MPAILWPFPGFDFLVAQFFGFVISVAWAFFFNRRYVFRTPNAPWKESLCKVYVVYSITGIGLSSLLSLLWVHVFGIPREVVTILNDTLCFPVNFLLNKYWSFRKKMKSADLPAGFCRSNGGNLLARRYFLWYSFLNKTFWKGNGYAQK